MTFHSMQATKRSPHGGKYEGTSADHHGHAPYGRRHPVPGSRGRLPDSGSGRQCDRRRCRRGYFTGCRAAGICQRRGRRPDHHLFRRRKAHRHDPGSRHLAEGARARPLQEAPRRENSARHLAHRGAGGARCMDHGARALWHHELRRSGAIGDQLRPRRLSRLPADVGDHHRHEAEYRTFPSNVALYLPKGRPPQPGEVFVQKALGATLQHMVDQEAAVRLADARSAWPPRAMPSIGATSPAPSSSIRRRTAVCCRPRIWRTIIRASTSQSRPRSATSSSTPAARGARGRRCCRRSTSWMRPSCTSSATTPPATCTASPRR